MKLVIIEDEKYTAKDLARTLLSIDPSLEIVDVIASVEDGKVFFNQNPNIDLIFSDIQLGDGLSFDIYESIDIKAPIIYCTAFDEYALKAFKTLGIDYILKPFDSESLKQALNKYQFLKGEDKPQTINTSDVVALLRAQLAPAPKTLLIRSGDKISPLAVKDIALFYIENEIVYAYTYSSKKQAVNQKLNALEEMFAESFFRTSRQYLISRNAIKDASHYFNRKLKVTLTIDFPEDVIVGKLKVSAFIEWWTQS